MQHNQSQEPGRAPEAATGSGGETLLSDTACRPRRRAGTGMLAAAVLVAGLSGCGVVAGTQSSAPQGSASSSSSTATSTDASAADTADTAVGEAAGKALPSVVTISATSGESSGSGSGSILDTEGHILTNTHVVTLAGTAADAEITVQTSDGEVYAATVVGTDPVSDLAVIKIDADGLTPIEVGSSSELQVGDDAIAIGAPLGLQNTVTDGIISTLDRTIAIASSDTGSDTSSSQGQGTERFRFQTPDDQAQTQTQTTSSEVYINVLQTDAAINPGNSGGALVNDQGQLVGVNVAIASASSGSSTSSEPGNIGVGFAIPVDYAMRVAQDLIDSGSASHGMLGVTVTPEAAEVQGADGETATSFSDGARVVEVVSGSAAEQAGLQADDVITAVGDRAVTDTASLTAAVREHREGDTVTVTFERDGQEQTAEVTVTAMEEAE